jgi:hypothetical protein
MDRAASIDWNHEINTIFIMLFIMPWNLACILLGSVPDNNYLAYKMYFPGKPPEKSPPGKMPGNQCKN